LLFERVLPPHSPAQLDVSPSRPRRPGCTPRAASGHPCGVTRPTWQVQTGGLAWLEGQVRVLAEDSVASRILRRMDDQKRETTYPNL